MPKGKTDKRWVLVCNQCGQEFISKQSFSKYCSNACKCKAYWPRTKLNPVNHFKRLKYSIQSRDKITEVTEQDLEKLYTEQGGLCALTGFPLTFVRHSGKGMNLGTLHNCSVDRIDQTKGYTLENIRLVCYQANMMRSILSDTELLFWCSTIVTNLRKEAQRKQGKK